MRANSLQNGIKMSEEKIVKPLSGWWVFGAFATFFGVVILVNAVFITSALQSHSGLVIDDAYKKGLSYNTTLQEAKNQPNWSSEVEFSNGLLTWNLTDENAAVIEDAKVNARFFRPVKDGDDFNAELQYDGQGIYSLTPEFPVKGSWIVNLSAAWNNQTYKTQKTLIVR